MFLGKTLYSNNPPLHQGNVECSTENSISPELIAFRAKATPAKRRKGPWGRECVASCLGNQDKLYFT